MKIGKGRVFGATFALCTALLPTAALAEAWTPEGTATWVKVMRQIAVDAKTGNDHVVGVCKGINQFAGLNKEFVREVSTTQRWASSAHIFACSALNKITPASCSYLDHAIGELSHATPGKDPDEVVAVAGELKAVLASVAADFKEGKVCKRVRHFGLL